MAGENDWRCGGVSFRCSARPSATSPHTHTPLLPPKFTVIRATQQRFHLHHSPNQVRAIAARHCHWYCPPSPLSNAIAFQHHYSLPVNCISGVPTVTLLLLLQLQFAVQTTSLPPTQPGRLASVIQARFNLHALCCLAQSLWCVGFGRQSATSSFSRQITTQHIPTQTNTD